MYARVARWEGGEPEKIRRAADEIASRAGSGPPEGVPAKGLLLLVDPDGGRGMAVTLFETEEDYRQGDDTLNRMNPLDDGFGGRLGVEKYEVAVDVRAP